MKAKHFGAYLGALLMLQQSAAMPALAVDDAFTMQVTVDLAGEQKAISPMIYGANDNGHLDKMRVNAVRQGGNRLTGYNWETNFSNAGSDWKHSSDTYMVNGYDAELAKQPAAPVLHLSQEAEERGIGYKLATLQMAGYVAADGKGSVTEAEVAPSDRWVAVKPIKGSAFDDMPDTTDDAVYMDEYVNYLVKHLGDAESPTGIQGYSLDNEVALWSITHSRLHPDPVTIPELAEKSIATAKAVKSVDPKAEVFGPALYGYTAFDHLADEKEWKQVKEEGGYHWYLDCYLDQMKQASEEYGSRLLDVLDVHYYSESCRNGAEDRLQSVRTLYEKGFKENSWIGQWCQQNIPILPTIQKSIDTYFPGTKLAISEYCFGGEDVSGTIAQAEALGCYADAGVYFATLWGGDPYIFAGMNLYTNYNGKGDGFGDTLVPTKTDDVSLSSSYAAIDTQQTDILTVMVTNKDMKNPMDTTISIENGKQTYKAAAIFSVYDNEAEVRLYDTITEMAGNQLQVTLPAYSASMVVFVTDAKKLEQLTPDAPTEIIETFTDNTWNQNDKGNIEVPVTDAARLQKVVLYGDVASSAGSGWAVVGGAICINAKDENGKDFWTSKGFTMQKGSNTVEIEFDGTFIKNAGEENEETVNGVIADGKIELQRWWESSEKGDAGMDDSLTLTLRKIEMVYAPEESQPQPEILAGDLDCDGERTISDAVLLCRVVVGDTKVQVSEAGMLNADVTGDGKRDDTDLTKLLQFLAKIIKEI